MLTESKLIYGPFNLVIDDGTDTGSSSYMVSGLQKDAVTITEEVTKEELEDGVERELMRKLTVEAIFSELNASDIATIQGLGDGSDNDLYIQFETAGREIVVADDSTADEYIKYTAEVEDGKMKITAQKTSANVDSANFTTNSSVTSYS